MGERPLQQINEPQLSYCCRSRPSKELINWNKIYQLQLWLKTDVYASAGNNSLLLGDFFWEVLYGSAQEQLGTAVFICLNDGGAIKAAVMRFGEPNDADAIKGKFTGNVISQEVGLCAFLLLLLPPQTSWFVQLLLWKNSLLSFNVVLTSRYSDALNNSLSLCGIKYSDS